MIKVIGAKVETSSFSMFKGHYATYTTVSFYLEKDNRLNYSCMVICGYVNNKFNGWF